MESKLQESIIKTLTYFDIFDYPVTLLELKKYSDIKIAVSDEELLDVIDSIYMVKELNGFFYLIGREKNVEKRLSRGEISMQKMVKAKVIAKALSRIPTVKLIGVSGSLSMNNSTPDDDIDLFFITEKNTLWITRLLVTLTLLLIGQKRKRKSKVVRNKICPNMYLAEDALSFIKRKQNLYLAHEILQLKVLFDRDNFYSRLLQKNKWIEKFLPNAFENTVIEVISNKFANKRLSSIFGMINSFCFLIQKLYMMPVITIERISSREASFHPVDKGRLILDLYGLKSRLNIEKFNSNQWVESEEARFYFDEKKMRILN